MSKPRRFYRDVDGIVLLDKPLGLSSNAALQQVRALFGAKKAGHAGSLDPLASGLLPICFGQATKVCGRLLNAGKTYRVDVHLGARTPSLDGETEIIERAPVPQLDAAAVDAVLATFAGEQQQIPPMHSALKHQGKRLYELARRGESVERAPRQIMIHRIQRIALEAERLEFEVRCSKGTYVRTLAADIAQRLGTLGYLAGLRRLSVDPFDGYPMYTLAQIEARLGSDAQIHAHTQAHIQGSPAGLDDAVLLSADTAFMDLARIDLAAAGEHALLLGQTTHALTNNLTNDLANALAPAPGEPLRAYGPNERFLGLVESQPDGRISPVRLFVGAAGTQS